MRLMELVEQEYKKANDKKLYLSSIQLIACNPAIAKTIEDFKDIMNFIFKKQDNNKND